MGPTCSDMLKFGDVIMVNVGHRAKPFCFCMILDLDLMPTAADMLKLVDVIMVNRGHGA